MNKIKLIFFVLLFSLKIYGQTPTTIAQKAIKSTVSIITLDNIAQPLGFGSGFIIGDELVVTNVHVIEGCSSAYVLINGQQKKYIVSGYVSIDKTNDLVLLKVVGLIGEKLKLASDFIPEIGEKIYAVGNPKGLNGTFSEGIISGIREFGMYQVLQITAPISPGSSGGPVINSVGDVVGVAFASFDSGQNLNFAIPVKYLSNLALNTSTITSLTNIKSQIKTSNPTSELSNIKEGVVVRNIEICSDCSYNRITFSVKNNLAYTVSDIRILILVFDESRTVVDYFEKTYYEYETLYGDKGGIKPFLARTKPCCPADIINNEDEFSLKEGIYFEARVLDFKIIQD